MMIDSKLYFGADLDCSQTFGTAVLIGDVIDLGVEDRFPMNGEPLHVVVTCDEQIITLGTAGTCEFLVVTATDADLTADAVTVARSHQILTDDATALGVALAADDYSALENKLYGRLWVSALPPTKYHRYVGFKFLANAVTTSAGKCTAFLTQDAATWRPFAAAV